MRAVTIRVSRASITINDVQGGEIGQGLLVLLGVGPDDTEKEARYLADKCAGLRIFEDENGKMNKSLADIGGRMMVVSNFTLYADCSHGRRPDLFGAAKPDKAIPLYEYFKSCLKKTIILIFFHNLSKEGSVTWTKICINAFIEMN